MSHNYPYRQAPNDSDRRSDPRQYSSAANANLYRRPQESFPSSSRSSAAPQPTQSPQDSVLSLLSSCGLEPGDLAVLAKLPEDVLTVESLPHLIKQIKGKKGMVKPFPPRPSSPPPPSSSRSFSSTHRPSASSSSLDWEKLRRQPVQYPLHMISSSISPSDSRSDHGSVRSSSVRPVQDTDLRPRLSNYGKATSSCSSVEHKKTRPSRFSDSGKSDYRSVPPPDERRRRSGSTSSSLPPAHPVPSKQQALDFHGSLPSVYPYSCSLCDITVLSEKAWLDHINGTVHADGQLKLLQQFTNWDCRVKHSNRNEDQSHRRRAGASSAPSVQRPNQNQVAHPNRKLTTPTDRGRVVCVKFPAQSVDEAYLQACIEPFGKMGKILMFPSVAFVELGTVEQAKDLVKFYTNLDPAENTRQLDFSISNTFSFLQSSQVVSFTPAPSGRDGRSDLISIIKRFGEPLYSLFLPSKAFIEMKLPADAKKLVDYYSSNVLKLNDDSISVSFSTEYKTLMRVSLATRCDEEATETTASSTAEPSTERRTRSKSRDGPRLTGQSKNRSKERSSHGSRSRDRSRREGRSRSRENKRDKSKSEERSSTSATGQNQTEVKIEEPIEPEGSEKIEEPEGSEGPEEPSESKEPEEPGAETRSAGEPEDSGPGAEEDQLDDEQKFSADDSDIEGMEVIEEDGEKLKDEDAKSQEEESQEETNPEEAAASPEGEDDNEVKSMELDEEEEEEEVKNEEAEEEWSRMKSEEEKNEEAEEEWSRMKSEEEKNEEAEEEWSRMKSEEEEHGAADTEDEEPGFPVDLENCITLDEVDCEDEGEAGQGDGSEFSEPSRVLFFSTMPEDYTDTEFIQVLGGLGTVVRYLLIKDRKQGFIEMSTATEAQNAVEVLNSEPVHINGTRLMGCLFQEYCRLSDGWAVTSDEDKDQETKSSTDRTPELETFQKTDETLALETDETLQKTDETFQEKTDETSELDTSETFQKTDETSELDTSETFQKTDETFQEKTDETSELDTSETFQKTDETSELDTSETFQKTDETSELETSETFQKTDETPELETSETFQEKTTDETPEKETSENTSVRWTRSKRIPQPTSDRKTRSKKIPDKEKPDKVPQRRTRSKMSPEETTEMPENVPETSPDTKTSVGDTPETEVSEKSPETDPSSKTSEELRTPSEKEPTGRKTVKGKTTPRKSPETRTDKRKGTPEDTVPLKTMKIKVEPLQNTNQPKDGREKSTGETKPSEAEVKKSEDLDHPEPPEQDSEMEQQPAPAEGAAEPEKPSKPVGPEFVRPVVGYFCNLCQLIFIDEDEAKLQHCSTPEHYRKYQEKTGKDPWSS